MPASKKELEIKIRISKAERRTVQMVVKDLRAIRDAARQVSAALNSIGAARVDVRKLNSISKALAGISTATKKIRPQDSVNIGKVAKALQQFKAIGGKEVSLIRNLTAQINQLTAAASRANIQTLAKQLGALNKALIAMSKNTKAISTSKTLLENISKIRFKTAANGIKAMSDSVVNLSRRFIRNKEKIDEAIKILRGFKNAANQAFRVDKLSAFEQKVRSIVGLLDSALSKTAKVSGTVLGSTSTVTRAAAGAATGGPAAPSPQQQRAPLAAGTATEKQLHRDAAALAKVTAQLDALQKKAETLKQQAKQFEAAGRGSTALADKLGALEPKYDALAAKGKVLTQTLRNNAPAANKLGIQVSELDKSFVTTATATKDATSNLQGMAANMSSLAARMKQPLTFGQMLSEGFDKIAASQIKFFAASLLLYRGLQLISEQFGKILEISDRTAKAFAVSRSNVVLLEERYELLGSTIEETTARTGRSIQDVSEILFQFGSAGLQAEEAFAALDSTLNLIIATDADVTLTTKTVAATYRLLGDTLDDVGGQAEKFGRINDVIAAAYRDNQVEINELTQAYKFAIPVAKQLRLSFEETTGIISTLQNNMIRAGEAGRSLRAIFSRVSSQSKEFAAAFGIAIDPTQPLDFLDILEQVNARMQEGSLTADQVGTVFQRLGLRGANAFLILTQNMDDVRKTIKTLETDSQGAARAMADIRLQTPAGQVKIFSENISRLIREGLTPLLGILFKIIQGINLFAKAISGTIVEKFIAAIAGIVSILVAAKLVMLAVTLVSGAYAAAKAKAAAATLASAAALEAETIAVVENASVEGVNITTTEALAKAKLNLAAASGASGGALARLGTAALALGAKLAIVLAIVAAVAAIFLLFAKRTEISIWWNTRQLDTLRNEVRERKKQSDSIEESIKKVKDLEQAQRRGLATAEDVSNAIAEAASKHENLAVAAALAGGNVSRFLQIAAQEKEILDDAISDINLERQKLFKENLEDLTSQMSDLVEAAKREKEIIDRVTSSILNNANLTDEQKKAYLKNNVVLRHHKDALSNILSSMRENKSAFGEQIKDNKDLINTNIGLITTYRNLGKRLGVTDDKSKKVGDAFVALGRQARNLRDIDFSKQIDQLISIGGAAQTGLEGFSRMVLFEFEILPNKESLNNTINEINDKVRQINEIELAVESDVNTLDLFEEAARTVQGVEIEIDLTKIEEQSTALGNTFATAISQAVAEANIDASVLFQDVTGEELFDITGLTFAVARQKELLDVSQDALETAEDYSYTQQTIADAEKAIVTQIENRASILKAEAKGDLVKIRKIDEDRARSVGYINELFKNRIALYNFLLQAQLKSLIPAEQFALITEYTDSLLAQRGQINEDDLAVQRDRIKILEAQRTVQQGLYEQAVSLTEEATQTAISSTDITVEIKQQAEAAAKLAETMEAIAAARVEEFNILERVNSLYAKARNDINQQRLGVEATSGSLRGQLDELRKIYGIQANTRTLIDATNAKEKERIQNATQTSREIEFANGAAGNSTEIAANFLAFKVKEFEIQQKITEEVRKTNEALRNSIQDLEVTRTGNSKVLDLRFKISNLLEDEDRLNEKIRKHESVRASLDIARVKRSEIIVQKEEKLEELRKISATKGLRNRKQIISLEDQLSRLRIAEIRNLDAIKTKDEDIKNIQSEANKIILTRLQTQRDLVITEFDYRDAVYQTLQGFDDVRSSVLDTLNLEDSRLARQNKLNRLAIESARVENRRKQLQNEIVTLSGTTLENSTLSQDQQRRAFELARDQADVISKILDAHKQIAEELQNQEIELSEQLSSIYQKQLDILTQISDKINENLKTELQFTFNQQPFTEMIGAAQLLGESLFEIERIGTDEVLRRLHQGFADGSISADNFTGQMYDAVAALRALNEQQQRLIEAQNKLQEARYELGLQKFSRAFAAGDFEKALEALGEMENAAEVIDSITGEVDVGKTLGRLQTAAFAGEELAKAMRNAKEENKDSFEIYARAQELLDTINTVTKDIFDNIGGTTFSAKFLQQLDVIYQKFRTMSGLLRQISNLEPGGEGPAPLGLQHGGGVPGIGTGDIVPAMLEPGEYVIPKNVVEKLGIGFFERIRRFKTGGLVGMQVGGEVFEGAATTASALETTSLIVENPNNVVFGDTEITATSASIEAAGLVRKLAEEFQYIAPGEEGRVIQELSVEELKEILADLVASKAKAREEKIATLAEGSLTPESFPPGEFEKALEKPLEEIRMMADAFKDVDVEIIEDVQESIAINLVYKDQLEMLRQQLATLSPTEISLRFTETGLSEILSRLPTIQTGERLAGLQRGGPVGGSGIGDVIPALLEPGEFVIRKNVVDKIGMRFFEGINRYKTGGIVGRYQEGGGVSQEKFLQLLSALETATTATPKLQEIKAEDIVFEKIPTLQAIKAEDIVFEELPTVRVVLGEIEIKEPVTIGEIEFIETPAPGPAVAALQTGGPVSGSGLGDIVPAMLEPGEYVIPRGVVSALGTGFFDALRNQNVLTNIRRVIRGTQNTFNAVFGGGQNIPAFQAAVTSHEGLVPGVQTGDVVAANLDEGDYVIPKSTVKLFGADFFSRLRDPELVRELVQSNRERILDNISHNDFVNRREDVITEGGRRVQALRRGGTVGFAHYQRGTGRGGAAFASPEPSSVETNIELIKSGIFGLQEIFITSLASVISKLSAIASVIKNEVVNLLTVISDPEFERGAESGEIEFTLGEVGISGGAEVAQVANDAAEASENLEKASEHADKMGAAISEAAPAAADIADSTKDVKDSTKAAAEQPILGENEEQNLKVLNNLTEINTEGAISLADAWKKISDGLKGQGKSSVDIISGVWGKFQNQVESSNKAIKDLIKTILGPFKSGVTAALKSIGEEFSTLFKDAIPGFIGSFVENVLVANARVEADYRRSLNDIKDTFNDQRADLVEQLKRNEISYFDYFNKLEDLQHDSADQRNDIEQDRLNELQENINGTFRELAQGFSDLIVDLTDQFSSFFDKVVDGAVGFLESLEPIFENFAAGIGVVIETAIGLGGGAGIGAALGGALGFAGGGVGAPVGLAIGAAVGGAIGEIFTSIVPIVGDIAKVFEDILSSMVQGAAQLIPILIDLATLPQEEFVALFGGTVPALLDENGEIIREAYDVDFAESTIGMLPDVIADMGAQLIERLGVIAERVPEIIPKIADAFLDLIAPSEENAKSVITAVVDTMVAVMPTIATELINVLSALSKSLPDIFTGIFQSIVGAIRTLFEDPQAIKDAIGDVIDAISDTILSAESDFITPIAQILGDELPPLIRAAAEKLKEVAPDIITALSDAIVASAYLLADISVVIIGALVTVLTDPAVVKALTDAFFSIVFAVFGSLAEAIPGGEVIFGFIGALAGIVAALAAGIGGLLVLQAALAGLAILTVLGPFIAIFVANLALLIPILAILVPTILAMVGFLSFLLGLLGSIVLKPVIDIFALFAEVIGRVAEKIGESKRLQDVAKRFEVLFQKLGAAFGRLFEAFAPDQANPDVVEGIADVIIFFIEVLSLVLEPLTWLINSIVIFTELLANWVQGIENITNSFNGLAEAGRFLTWVIGEIEHVLWGGSLIPALESLLSVLQTVTGFIESTATIAFDILANAINLVLTPIQDLGNFIQDTLVGAFESLLGALEPIATFIEGLSVDVPGGEDIPTAAGNAAGGLVETGKDIYNATLGQVFGTLHSGGIFPTDMDTTNVRALAADEGIAVLRAGEGVLTHAGVEAIGGPSAVDAANGGADIFTTIPPKALQGGEETTFGEANTGFGVEPASNEQGPAGEGETTINLDISFNDCQFNGEDVADVVEGNIAEKLQNRDGVMYKEIRKQKGNNNTGIRRR